MAQDKLKPYQKNGEVFKSSTASRSRRNFLKGVGISGVAVAASSCAARSASAPESAIEENDPEALSKVAITLKVNGEARKMKVQPNAVLLDVLRDDLQLTGTKKGCDHGQCGACNLHVNGKVINSCLSLAVMHDGDDITTIEGLSENGEMSAVQKAFHENDAFQCGYCTAGQMMTADYVIRSDDIPASPEAWREAMSGNICRCGAYKNILSAMQQASKHV